MIEIFVPIAVHIRPLMTSRCIFRTLHITIGSSGSSEKGPELGLALIRADADLVRGLVDGHARDHVTLGRPLNGRLKDEIAGPAAEIADAVFGAVHEPVVPHVLRNVSGTDAGHLLLGEVYPQRHGHALLGHGLGLPAVLGSNDV